MTQRIDLAVANKPVREFICSLGKFREPIELVFQGTIVAKLIPPSELSDTEKERVLQEGWQVVEKARTNAARLSAGEIQKAVDQTVREVRGRNDCDGACVP
jgi:hypothetical protein